MTTPLEEWASGDAYEQFMGRWSGEIARLFMDWLQPAVGLSWLDMGCGTGALSRAISATTEAKIIVGIDPSLDFLRYAGHRLPAMCLATADASALPITDNTFDLCVSGLALNFVPEPEIALRELARVVKPGGVVAVYIWDYADKMEYLRYFWDAASDLDTKARSLHEGNRFPICNPQTLMELWSDSGLRDVVVHPLDARMMFDDFDSYWLSFTSGSFPAPQYALSLGTRERELLRDHLQKTIPAEDDGSIHLLARAWAVRGIKAPG